MSIFDEYCLKNELDEFQTFLIKNLETIIKNNNFSENLFDEIKNKFINAKNIKYNCSEDVKPKHYTKLAIEPIKLIVEQNLNFCEGNIVKYVSRLGKKDEDKAELKKIFFYFDYLINKNDTLTKSTFNTLN